MRKCEICGAELPEGSRARYCTGCRDEKKRRNSRAQSERKRAARPRRSCITCGLQLPEGSRATYCPECRRKRAREQDRTQRARVRRLEADMDSRQEKARGEAEKTRGLPHYRTGMSINEMTMLAREHHTTYGKLMAWMDLHRRRPRAGEALS